MQATAETEPFERSVLDELLDLAEAGIAQIKEAQMDVIARVVRGNGGRRYGPAVTEPLRVVLATRQRGQGPGVRPSARSRRFRRAQPCPRTIALPEETGQTFAANARLKAEAVFAALGGAMAVLADDSGLEVAALERPPGGPVGPVRR